MVPYNLCSHELRQNFISCLFFHSLGHSAQLPGAIIVYTYKIVAVHKKCGIMTNLFVSDPKCTLPYDSQNKKSSANITAFCYRIAIVKHTAISEKFQTNIAHSAVFTAGVELERLSIAIEFALNASINGLKEKSEFFIQQNDSFNLRINVLTENSSDPLLQIKLTNENSETNILTCYNCEDVLTFAHILVEIYQATFEVRLSAFDYFDHFRDYFVIKVKSEDELFTKFREFKKQPRCEQTLIANAVLSKIGKNYNDLILKDALFVLSQNAEFLIPFIKLSIICDYLDLGLVKESFDVESSPNQVSDPNTTERAHFSMQDNEFSDVLDPAYPMDDLPLL